MLAIALDLLLVSISCLGYLARPYVGHLKWLAKWLSVFDAVDDAYRAAWTWLQVKLGQLDHTDIRLMELGRAIQKTATGSSSERDLLSQFNGENQQGPSGLILYYIQVHSDNLTYLYAFISRLLERAGLVCPADSAAAAASHRHLLDRYALLLMIVAHLGGEHADDETRQKKRKTSNEQIALTSNLLGFLKCYSQETNIRVSNDIASCGGSLPSHTPNLAANTQVKLAKTTATGADKTDDDDDDDDEQKLVVLNPLEIASTDGDLETTDGTHDVDANLTRQLTVWPEIRQLFGQIHAELASDLRMASEPSKNNAPSQPQVIVSDLFRLCAAHGAKGGHNDGQERDELLMDSDDDDEVQSSDMSGRQAAEVNNGKRGSASSWAARLKQNKLAKSLLYLALFVFLRLVLVRNLESWQRDLWHQARGDFINLKLMLFPEMQTGRLDKHEHDDGISILLRGEHDDDDHHRDRTPPSSWSDDKSDGRQAEQASSSQEDEIINGDGGDLLSPETEQRAEDAGAKSSGELSEEEQGAQVVEALLMAVLSRAMGGGATGGVPMTPDKLQGFMEILARNAASAGDGESESGGEGEEGLDDEAIARIMEQMSGLMGGQESQAGAQDDEGKQLGSQAEANINSAPGDDDGDDNVGDSDLGDDLDDYEDVVNQDEGSAGSSDHHENSRTDL